MVAIDVRGTLTQHPQGYANVPAMSVSPALLFKAANQNAKETYFRDNLASTHFYALKITCTLWVWERL